MKRLKSQGLSRCANGVLGSWCGASQDMGIGPVESSTRYKAGLRFEDMEVIELNEAFAAQSLACIRSWGLPTTMPASTPMVARLPRSSARNTGARILPQQPGSLNALVGYGLVTLCIGGVKATPRSLKTPVAERHGVCIQRHDPVVDPTSFVHPQATLIGHVTIGPDCYAGPHAVLRGDWGKIVLERGCNVQEGCVIHMFPGETVL